MNFQQLRARNYVDYYPSEVAGVKLMTSRDEDEIGEEEMADHTDLKVCHLAPFVDSAETQ